MSTSTWMAWLADGAPRLPSLWLHQMGQHLGWALVLAALAMVLLKRLPTGWRWGLVLALAALAWVPGPQGLAYWLGLAFQTPSLSSMLLAAGLLWRAPLPGRRFGQTGMWLALGVLGALLLLDTLALLPWPLYAWGYGPVALVSLLALAAAMTLDRCLRAAGWWLLAVVALFGLTRLPSGNLWDALVDPWLLVLACTVVLRRLMHRKR